MPSIATLDSLELRLRSLQDFDEIEILKARYWSALDRKQPASVEACLHPEVVVDFEGLPRYESRESFMVMAKDAARNPNTYNMHHGHNPQIAPHRH